MKNLKFLFLLLITIGSFITLTTQIINKNKNNKDNKYNLFSKSKRNLIMNNSETLDICIRNNFTSNELLNYLNVTFVETQIEKYFKNKNTSV